MFYVNYNSGFFLKRHKDKIKLYFSALVNVKAILPGKSKLLLKPFASQTIYFFSEAYSSSLASFKNMNSPTLDKYM